jgi:hypothetical protein
MNQNNYTTNDEIYKVYREETKDGKTIKEIRYTSKTKEPVKGWNRMYKNNIRQALMRDGNRLISFWAYLWKYFDITGKVVLPKYDKISKESGLNKHSISRLIKQLKDKEYIGEIDGILYYNPYYFGIYGMSKETHNELQHLWDDHFGVYIWDKEKRTNVNKYTKEK